MENKKNKMPYALPRPGKFFDRNLIILLAGGLLVRLLFAIPVFADISRTATCYDAVSYDLLARHMLDAKGFSVSFEAPYKPNSTITPGYPLFVAGVYAITGRSKLAVILIQIILNLILLAILYRFLAKRFGDRSALWAGILFIVDINTVFYCTQLTTETLFTLLLILFLILLLHSFETERIGRAVACGVLLGMTTLVRPIALYFTAPLLLFLFLTRFRWRKLLQWGVILGLQVMIITPWIIRNRVVFGETFYTTISDVNIYKYHAAPLKALIEGTTRPQAQTELDRKAEAGHGDLNEAIRYRLYGSQARKYLLSHPVPYIGSLVGGGFASLLYPLTLGEIGAYFHGEGVIPKEGVTPAVMPALLKGRFGEAFEIVRDSRLHYFGTLLLLMLLMYGIFHMAKLGCGLRAYILKGLRDPAMLLFLLTGLYFLGLVSFGFSPRARVPLEPLLVSLAGIGLVAKRTEWKLKKKGKVERAK